LESKVTTEVTTPDWKIDLEARVKRLPGWRISRTRAGVRITAPNGESTAWHNSDGSYRLQQNVMKELRRCGFVTDEKKFLATDEQRRKAKIEADRKENDAKLRAAEARAAALSKAAGPYAADALTLEWMLSKHPAPAIKRGIITPEMCEKILADHNNHNRQSTNASVDFFANHMIAGTMPLTHQGVAFDWNGEVLDGQNRMKASVKTGLPFETFVTVGLDPATFVAIDSGKPRSTKDAAYLAGVQYPVITSGAARLVYLYQHVDLGLWRATKVTSDQIVATLKPKSKEKATQAEFETAARMASTAYSRTKFPSPAHCAAMYLLRTSPNNEDDVAEWLHGLHTSVGITRENDSREALRRFVANAKQTHRQVTGVEFLALFIKAWNLHVEGRGITFMKWGAKEGMPRLSILERGRS
jgi:hypothetical protein